MLASDAPTLGKCGNGSALRYWHLRISKIYDKPGYYIGQTVLHKMKVRQGEILHPVEVIGLRWTGIDWEYAVELPENHPQFELENHEWAELAEWQIEPM